MGLFNFLFGSSEVDTSPSMNVDGTPMCGSLDINGNPYGVTEMPDCSSSMMDDSFASIDSSCGFDDDNCGGFDDW